MRYDLAMQHRAVIVHSFDHATAALETALKLSRPIMLVSAPDAGLQSGPAWFASLVEQATEAVPGAEPFCAPALLDCGDKPGCVLAALRHGLRHICFTGDETARAKLRDIGESLGATIIAERPQGLDLLGLTDPQESCRSWLECGQTLRY